MKKQNNEHKQYMGQTIETLGQEQGKDRYEAKDFILIQGSPTAFIPGTQWEGIKLDQDTYLMNIVGEKEVYFFTWKAMITLFTYIEDNEPEDDYEEVEKGNLTYTMHESDRDMYKHIRAKGTDHAICKQPLVPKTSVFRSINDADVCPNCKRIENIFKD